MKGIPSWRLFNKLNGNKITEKTSEIQKLVIAREILK
jgi:hypothetical protein